MSVVLRIFSFAEEMKIVNYGDLKMYLRVSLQSSDSVIS